MSLAQQLLVRALVAWFWREPYGEPLIRWGTRLHDRFLLPYFVDQDFGQVLRDLAASGLPVRGGVVCAVTEFRFPVYGRVQYDGIDIELRQAIEPWYVLGEEPGAGGTARYVDSSVERLQVRVRGLSGPSGTPSRATAAACRCSRPATQGDFVCGVRYRAWQPPRCLHPTIPVHAPLVFDLIDIEPPSLNRWVHLSRGASGWPELRHVSGKLERSRGPSSGAVLRHGPHTRSRR